MTKDEALDLVDWDDAANTFKKMNWIWAIEGLPNATDLRNKASYMIDEMIKNNYNFLGTGRITVVNMDDCFHIFIGHEYDIPADSFTDVKMHEALS